MCCAGQHGHGSRRVLRSRHTAVPCSPLTCGHSSGMRGDRSDPRCGCSPVMISHITTPRLWGGVFKSLC